MAMNDEVKKSGMAMKELIERALLLGVGAASMTMEKIQSLVDEFVKRGQLTREEGQKLVEDMTERAKTESSGLKGKATETYQDTLQTMGIATRDSVDELERRIAVLEAKVYGKPSHVEEPRTGFSSTTTEKEKPS
jgi:polyhydroxyalkanoate synthesis regulator phasin